MSEARKRVSPGEVLDAIEKYKFGVARDMYVGVADEVCPEAVRFNRNQCYCGLGLMVMGPWREDFEDYCGRKIDAEEVTLDDLSALIEDYAAKVLGRDYRDGFTQGFDGTDREKFYPVNGEALRGYKDGRAVWNKIEAAAKKGKAAVAMHDDRGAVLATGEEYERINKQWEEERKHYDT